MKIDEKLKTLFVGVYFTYIKYWNNGIMTCDKQNYSKIPMTLLNMLYVLLDHETCALPTDETKFLEMANNFIFKKIGNIFNLLTYINGL